MKTQNEARAIRDVNKPAFQQAQEWGKIIRKHLNADKSTDVSTSSASKTPQERSS